MILVDACVIMYAAGVAHPNKERCVGVLEKVARGEIDAAVDAGVLQEILHRYRAIRRWPDGGRVYDLARAVFPVVIAVTAEVLDRARALLDEIEGVMARDALHAAVAQVHRLDGICTCDRDFDRIPGVRRIDPAELL